MNRINRAQRDKLNQFRSITGGSEKIAVDCLKVANWNLEASLDYYYNAGFASSIRNDTKSLENLFAKYKEAGTDIIYAEGIQRFCEDLGVDPSDIVMLVISWYMNAATMCEYSKEEFISGMQKMHVDSVDKLKKKIPELRNDLKDDNKFREIYNYSFMFAREKNQKCLQLDTALAMWQLIFSEERRWALIDDWCEFLQKHHNRALSKDTWTQLFEFAKTIKPDFSNFDENGAWPYLLDEFVDYMRQKQQS